MGRLTEDGYLQCAYHAWCYDGASAQCTAIPNLSPSERVPPGVKVRAFAVEIGQSACYSVLRRNRGSFTAGGS